MHEEGGARMKERTKDGFRIWNSTDPCSQKKKNRKGKEKEKRRRRRRRKAKGARKGTGEKPRVKENIWT